MEFNPGRFEKSALVKHYTAQQTLAKALKTPAKTTKKSAKEDAVKFITNFKKTPNAPARSGKALEIEKLLRQVAAENGIERAAEAPGDGWWPRASRVSIEQRERGEPADGLIGHRADAKRDGAVLPRAVSSLRPKLTPLACSGRYFKNISEVVSGIERISRGHHAVGGGCRRVGPGPFLKP